ncbi:hypothetical protein HHI36_004034 [Cryptolaemus montrouzieri]|uniref:Reverse transcriptase domain-containing protein n=1 Tax=Cryptolaemus montrouzieri TaxID=559131 RepID=A0ABD2NQ12_9CUCU
MTHWRTSLQVNTNNKSIKTDEIPIRRGIFQGDSLSSLWFCLAMNSLSSMLNRTGYEFRIKIDRNYHTISHLLYMDDIKLYASKKKQLDDLLKTASKFSVDVHMKFGIEK